jgi:MoaA/NifB/PqqE/SkfB family radical SAM enzyme
MCCFQRANPVSPESPYLGNILEQSFDDIWFGALAEEVRIKTIEGSLHPLCQTRGCPFFSGPKIARPVDYGEYPAFLELDLPNTHCNVGLENPNEDHPACIMCERAAPPDVFHPEQNKFPEILPRIAHLMPHIRHLHIQGIAEPFYKDIIFEMLETLDFAAHKNQIELSTTTNGILFRGDVMNKYLQGVPRSITTFSIDAGSAWIYQNIRILPVFDQVITNLMEFSKRRSLQQHLQIHNNINTMNVDEVIEMVRIAHRAKVNRLEFSPTDGFNWKILVNEENCGKFKKAQMDIEDECKKLHVPVNFIRPLDMGLMDRLVQITL